jgi:hypothetical protein
LIPSGIAARLRACRLEADGKWTAIPHRSVAILSADENRFEEKPGGEGQLLIVAQRS